MKIPSRWTRLLRLWRADVAQDVDVELEFHVEMRVQEFMSRGMSEGDARRAVAERLGNVDAARAECVAIGKAREMHVQRADWFDALRADIRFAFRSLVHTPGWTAVALLTVALGIGATTAVFSVADALLLRPFPYRDASRVYMARRQFTMGGDVIPMPVPDAVVPLWQTHAQTIESAVPFGGAGSGRLAIGADTIDIQAARVDTGFLAFIGAHPLLGRNFSADEIRPDGANVVLLSEPFWRRQFGGDRDVVGKVVSINNKLRTVIGVVPASVVIPNFRTERADVLVPYSGSGGASVLVRLKPGVLPETSEQELEKMLVNSGVPDIRPVPVATPLRLSRPQDWLAFRQPLLMLSVAAALLFVVAGANIAHLLLARGASRQRELAVRSALGAGRVRLVRLLVTESLLLAIVGGVLASAVGWIGLQLLRIARPVSLVALTYVSADWRLVVIGSTLAVATGVFVGILAALRIAHRDLGKTLRIGASSTALTSRRLRSSLVIGEVALSVTLLVGALLLVHAVFDLQRTQLGFDARDLFAVNVNVPEELPDAERVAVGAAALAQVTGNAEVRGASLARNLPGQARLVVAFEVPGGPEAQLDQASQSVAPNGVAADYFAFMGLPFVEGNTFDAGSAARNEIIVSAALAKRLWPNQSAIGKQLRNAVTRSRGVFEPWQTVVGVVPEVVSSLTEGMTAPALYRPLDASWFGAPVGGLTMLVRMPGAGAEARLRQIMSVDRANRPAASIVNVRESIDASIIEPRFVMRVLSVYAALAVILAAVGLFGVISYSVGQRTREIGVRMTLGATRASIARLVVGDGVRLTLVGIVIGLLGATGATRLIQNLLYGVPQLDPFSFGAGALLLLVIAGVACIVPMLRATGIDPAVAVRSE